MQSIISSYIGTPTISRPGFSQLKDDFGLCCRFTVYLTSTNKTFRYTYNSAISLFIMNAAFGEGR